MSKFYIILITLCTLMLSACNKYVVEESYIDMLLDSPETKSLDTMLIKATSIKVTREFNPPFTINGKKMRCQFTLVDTSGTKIEDIVTPLRLYVIKDDEVWETDFEDVQYLGKQIICYAEGGPKWEPKELVHVAIRFKLLNSEYTIINKHIQISRLDN